jgi:type II secretory pathway component PulJ
MISRPRPHRQGMMLYEALIAVMFMAVFATLSVEVVRSTLRVSRDAGEAAALSARFDGAVAQLRRDVWGAAKVSSTDPATLRIELPNAKPVMWTVTKDGALSRAAESDHQKWPEVAAGLTFEADATTVTIVEPMTARRDARRIPLVSQLAVAGRGAP